MGRLTQRYGGMTRQQEQMSEGEAGQAWRLRAMQPWTAMFVAAG
jgi:hypothetical protein